MVLSSKATRRSSLFSSLRRLVTNFESSCLTSQSEALVLVIAFSDSKRCGTEAESEWLIIGWWMLHFFGRPFSVKMLNTAVLLLRSTPPVGVLGSYIIGLEFNGTAVGLAR